MENNKIPVYTEEAIGVVDRLSKFRSPLCGLFIVVLVITSIYRARVRP